MYVIMVKEPHAMPNMLGNKSQPVHTHRWRDVACCAEKKPLEDMAKNYKEGTVRIEERDFSMD